MNRLPGFGQCLLGNIRKFNLIQLRSDSEKVLIHGRFRGEEQVHDYMKNR